MFRQGKHLPFSTTFSLLRHCSLNATCPQKPTLPRPQKSTRTSSISTHPRRKRGGVQNHQSSSMSSTRSWNVKIPPRRFQATTRAMAKRSLSERHPKSSNMKTVTATRNPRCACSLVEWRDFSTLMMVSILSSYCHNSKALSSTRSF